jgi:hypothetical protein
MHFDQRTQAALRAAGLDDDEISDVSASVVAATEDETEQLQTFFGSDPTGGDRDAPTTASGDATTLYSDMDLAHSTGDVTEHDVAYLDLFTHAADIRGYLRFQSWGVPVTGGRVLSDDVVELTLGPTVDDRVRFARDPESL